MECIDVIPVHREVPKSTPASLPVTLNYEIRIIRMNEPHVRHQLSIFRHSSISTQRTHQRHFVTLTLALIMTA